MSGDWRYHPYNKRTHSIGSAIAGSAASAVRASAVQELPPIFRAAWPTLLSLHPPGYQLLSVPPTPTPELLLSPSPRGPRQVLGGQKETRAEKGRFWREKGGRGKEEGERATRPTIKSRAERVVDACSEERGTAVMGQKQAEVESWDD